MPQQAMKTSSSISFNRTVFPWMKFSSFADWGRQLILIEIVPPWLPTFADYLGIWISGGRKSLALRYLEEEGKMYI